MSTSTATATVARAARASAITAARPSVAVETACKRATLALETGTVKLLPDANATETDVVVRGFTVNARIHPRGLPATWHVEYGATTAYGSTTTAQSLPGRLAAHYKETWSTTLAGYHGAITRDGLTWESGGYVKYTAPGDSSGDDANHASGIGYIQLPIYGYIGNTDPGDIDGALIRLGGGIADLRGAQISVKVRGHSWSAAGTRLSTWIQANNDTSYWYQATTNVANWCHTAADHTAEVVAATDWTTIQWTLRNRTQDWTYAGRNDGHSPLDRYWYGSLDKILGGIDLDIFLMQNIDVTFGGPYPSGAIDFDDVQIAYRQHNLCYSGNGGSVSSSPTGSSGAEYLTDGWRNEEAGGAGDWLSGESPTSPQDIVYAFADPVSVKFVAVHNSWAYPSKDIEVAVSSDGSTWTTITTGTLPQTHAAGPNFVYHFADNRDGDATFHPLHAGTVSYLRVRVTSGYQSTRWGLGEIEAFGTGATEATDANDYDVNQDVAVAAGTWHYRVVVTTSEGTTYGEDQTVTVV